MLKVFNLNIESHKHLDRFPEKINKYAPDVVCLQEVYEIDVKRIKKALGMRWAWFAPYCIIDKKTSWGHPPDGLWGQLLLSNSEGVYGQYYYSGSHVPKPRTDDPNSVSRMLQWLKLKKGGAKYRVINTHFTWSQSDEYNQEQIVDFGKMVTKLDEIPDFLLCGDFNIYRGSRLWDELAGKYTDNIPLKVLSTLDPKYFRIPNVKVVCDGFFTKGDHRVRNIKLVDKISDHFGIAGELVVSS
jgi:endonuclease/exonuclease/phosphatase family metal-dependent hydrolase